LHCRNGDVWQKKRPADERVKQISLSLKGETENKIQTFPPVCTCQEGLLMRLLSYNNGRNTA